MNVHVFDGCHVLGQVKKMACRFASCLLTKLSDCSGTKEGAGKCVEDCVPRVRSRSIFPPAFLSSRRSIFLVSSFAQPSFSSPHFILPTSLFLPSHACLLFFVTYHAINSLFWKFLFSSIVAACLLPNPAYNRVCFFIFSSFLRKRTPVDIAMRYTSCL